MNSLTVNAGAALFALGLASVSHAAKLEDTAPYPKAESGFTRQVIHLAPQPREDDERSICVSARSRRTTVLPTGQIVGTIPSVPS